MFKKLTQKKYNHSQNDLLEMKTTMSEKKKNVIVLLNGINIRLHTVEEKISE